MVDRSVLPSFSENAPCHVRTDANRFYRANPCYQNQMLQSKPMVPAGSRWFQMVPDSSSWFQMVPGPMRAKRGKDVAQEKAIKKHINSVAHGGNLMQSGYLGGLDMFRCFNDNTRSNVFHHCTNFHIAQLTLLQYCVI